MDLTLTPTEKMNIDRMEYILVHVGQRLSLLDHSGFCLDIEISEYGMGAEDFLSGPDEPGLWVGQGVPVWQPGTYECPQDGEMEYPFTYRRLTAEELAKVANGEGFWDERPYCNECHKHLHSGQELILESGTTDAQGETEIHDDTYCTKCYQKKVVAREGV